MNAYFATPELQTRLRHEVDRWIGTPFIAHARICGAGVDCVQLAGAIYIACGAIPAFEPEKYSLQEGKHARRSKVLTWLRANDRFAVVGSAGVPPAGSQVPWEPFPGDLLCMMFRQRVIHHVGIVLDSDKFVHVLEGRTVEVARMKNFKHAIRAVYRPLAIGDLIS